MKTARQDTNHPQTSFRSALFRAIPAACLWAVVGTAMTPDTASAYTEACAKRDLQLVILIEARGNAQDVAPERLANAVRIMTWARAACAQGQEREALAIYDSIDLGPTMAERPR
jgi:hypothetical protein